jgi:hypothetical protein
LPKKRSEETVSADQELQKKLLEEGMKMPGVAEVMSVYGELSAHMPLIVNAQPGQVRNATGGNPV